MFVTCLAAVHVSRIFILTSQFAYKHSLGMIYVGMKTPLKGLLSLGDSNLDSLQLTDKDRGFEKSRIFSWSLLCTHNFQESLDCLKNRLFRYRFICYFLNLIQSLLFELSLQLLRKN